MQTSVVCGVNTWQQIVDLSVHSAHVGDEVLFFDDDGEGLDTRVFFSIENSKQGLERQSCSFTVRIGEYAHTKWRGDHVFDNSKFLERCKEVTIRFWQEITSVFVLIGSSTVWSNDVNDVLETVAQCKRFGDNVVRYSTRWSVDLTHLEANVSSCLSQLLTCFLVNHVVKTFSSRESIVRWCNEDIARVIPDVSTDDAERTPFARSSHVQLCHQLLRRGHPSYSFSAFCMKRAFFDITAVTIQSILLNCNLVSTGHGRSRDKFVSCFPYAAFIIDSIAVSTTDVAAV